MFLQDNVCKLFFFRKTLSSIYFSEWNQTKKEKETFQEKKIHLQNQLKSVFAGEFCLLRENFVFLCVKPFFREKN